MPLTCCDAMFTRTKMPSLTCVTTRSKVCSDVQRVSVLTSYGHPPKLASMPARILPEKDRLRTLLLSGRSVPWIAKQYGVSRAAVYGAITRAGLQDTLNAAGLVQPRSPFIPWSVPVAHSNDYDLRMLRFYIRSIGMGKPILDPNSSTDQHYAQDRQGQLDLWRGELDAADVVLDYDPDHPCSGVGCELGFSYVARKPDDRHYVRWPAGVPDHRDAALARTRDLVL